MLQLQLCLILICHIVLNVFSVFINPTHQRKGDKIFLDDLCFQISSRQFFSLSTAFSSNVVIGIYLQQPCSYTNHEVR